MITDAPKDLAMVGEVSSHFGTHQYVYKVVSTLHDNSEKNRNRMSVLTRMPTQLEACHSVAPCQIRFLEVMEFAVRTPSMMSRVQVL
jgi:hypothetical protein